LPTTTRVINYTYDGLYRVTNAKYCNGLLTQAQCASASAIRSYTYAYDLIGNRKVNTVFDGSTTVTTNYTYDPASRLATSQRGSDPVKSYTYDANGNLTNDGVNTYAYDAANRLTTYTPGTDPATSFYYNGLGDRYRQTTNGVNTDYLLDLNAGLTQILSETTSGVDTTYLLGLDVLAQQKGTTWSYFGYDALGSTRQLTDTVGGARETVSYDPYGTPFEQSGTYTSTLGFTGEYTDATSLVYLRARYYNSATATFASMDPVQGLVGKSITFNPYEYAGENPILYTDPSGRFFFIPILVGFAIGTIASGVIDLAVQMAVEHRSLECIDKTRLGVAMLEGGLLGAIGGGYGAYLQNLVKAGALTAGQAAVRGLAANFIASTVSSMVFHQQSLGEALVSNAVGFGVGLGVGYLGGEVWSAGKAAWKTFSEGETAEEALREIRIVGFRGIGFNAENYSNLDLVNEPDLIKAGHVGIWFEGDQAIYGFHPSEEAMAAVEDPLTHLREGGALRGQVYNDAEIFQRAQELAAMGERTTVGHESIFVSESEFSAIKQTVLGRVCKLNESP
jgi:RHS repeat-associated protein